VNASIATKMTFPFRSFVAVCADILKMWSAMLYISEFSERMIIQIQNEDGKPFHILYVAGKSKDLKHKKYISKWERFLIPFPCWSVKSSNGLVSNVPS
jgi:hypothetical protein